MHSLCVFTSARETAPAAIITAGSLFSASLVVKLFWRDAAENELNKVLHDYTTISSQTAHNNNKSSAVAEMGDRLVGHNKHGPKVARGCFGDGSPLGPHLTQCGLGRGLPLYQGASSPIQPFGHNCRNATLLRVGIRLRTIFIPSLVVKTFTGFTGYMY